MVATIDKLVNTCETCQKVNKKLTKPAATLHSITVDCPWHRVGIDLVGPIDRTDTGNAYIIICTDYFTK